MLGIAPNMSAGITLVRRFFSAEKYSKFDSRAISVHIEPESELSPKPRILRFVTKPISLGMVPDRELSISEMEANFVSKPN